MSLIQTGDVCEWEGVSDDTRRPVALISMEPSQHALGNWYMGM